MGNPSSPCVVLGPVREKIVQRVYVVVAVPHLPEQDRDLRQGEFPLDVPAERIVAARLYVQLEGLAALRPLQHDQVAPVRVEPLDRDTVLEDKIIGAEIDIIEYQVIEAYEDYLAHIIAAYYSWYSAYENLKIGRSAYEQSLKLLENLNKRKQSKIALDIDVNKINIQTLTKKEDLVKLQEKYENIFNFIKQAIRYKGSEPLEPADPLDYNTREISFDADYRRFVQTSRTYSALNLLEQKSSLQLKKYADDLLPSVNLILGYTADGDDTDINNADQILYSGVSVTWPFPGQEERAQYETSKITHRKTQVSNKNKYVQLHTDLKNLYAQIEREKRLVSITQEKIALAESILEDETKNYSYGKVSLNDFIDAVNEVDKNKFDKILHSVELKLFMTEWLRLTDQLISRKDIEKIRE